MSQVETLRRKTHNLFEPRFYSKKEAAKVLGVCLRKIDVEMSEGRLPFIKMGRTVRLNGDALNEVYC